MKMLRREKQVKAITHCHWYCLLALLFVCGGCDVTSNAPPHQAQPTAKPTSSNKLLEMSDPNTDDAPEWRKEAWRRFTASGQYRIAHPNDFHIPEAAKTDKYRRLDLDSALSHPFRIADINQDKLFQDLAIIVVDTTRDDSQRFGLVIFNEPSDGKAIPSPHWLYHERDLSKTVLSKWSGGLILENFHEDGSTNNCYVNWNKRQQAYSCDKDYKH